MAFNKVSKPSNSIVKGSKPSNVFSKLTKSATSFLKDAKAYLIAYLYTEDSQYLLTEAGFRILLYDHSPNKIIKPSDTWTKEPK